MSLLLKIKGERQNKRNNEIHINNSLKIRMPYFLKKIAKTQLISCSFRVGVNIHVIYPWLCQNNKLTFIPGWCKSTTKLCAILVFFYVICTLSIHSHCICILILNRKCSRGVHKSRIIGWSYKSCAPTNCTMSF